MKTFEALSSSEEDYPRRKETSSEFGNDARLVIETFDKSRPRISEHSFVGFYPADEVLRDIKMTERLRLEFARRDEQASEAGFRQIQEVYQLATAMEVIVTQPLSWWGEGKTTRTSEYDDFMNGIDAVLELPGGQHIGFALDFSTSSSPEILQKKIDRATNHVLIAGKPAEVKYYVSPITKKRERITVVPIIIGLDSKDAKDLVGLVSAMIRMREHAVKNPDLKEKLTEKFETLKKHPAQVVFLMEIASQLNRYERLLEKSTDQKLITLREKIQSMGAFIDTLRKAKGREGIESGELIQDKVLAEIERITSE